MRKYQILSRRNSGRIREQGDRTKFLRVPVAELVSAAREGMRDMADRMGLELMRLAVEEERVMVTEGPRREGWKYGRQPGFVHWNGRKVAFPNMRVRGFKKGELKLRSYAKFQEDGVEGGAAMRDMMRGVSTRDYAEGAEGFLRGRYGITRSSVSRAFIQASAAKLKELTENDVRKILGIPFNQSHASQRYEHSMGQRALLPPSILRKSVTT
jgi:hypothetical protein